MTRATVAAIVRYPVKSLAGEPLEAAAVTPRGLDGDRSWGVYTDDGGIGSGKTTRRFRRIESLLQFAATTTPGGSPTVVAPDGSCWVAGSPEADAALSALLGQPVSLRPETAVRHHDEAPLHLLALSSVAAVSAVVGARVDWRRFRPSLLLETGPGVGSGAGSGASSGAGSGVGWDSSLDDLVEDSWIGRDLAIGADLVVRVTGRMQRCVVVGMAQRDLDDGLGDDPRVLRALRERPEVGFGVKADVVRPGTVRAGDVVRVT